MTEISLILHTCDKYSFCWDPFFKFTDGNLIDCRKYFCTEELSVEQNGWINLKTGSGEWSNRLITILNAIDTPYIAYMQEDFWPYRKLELDIFNKCFTDLKDENLSAFYITSRPPNKPEFGIFKDHSLFEGYQILEFAEESPYLLNHQFGIWNRLDLLDLLIENESPWNNEIHGTHRIRKAGNHNKYRVIDFSWYNTVVRKGQFTDDAYSMLQNSNQSAK